MKKIILSVMLTILCIFAFVTFAYAQSPIYKYGTPIVSANMEGQLWLTKHCDFSNIKSGTTEMVYKTGKKSFYLDCTTVETGQWFLLTSDVHNEYDLGSSALYFEAYAKGFETLDGNLKFTCYYQNTDNVVNPTVSIEEADENGWHKISCMVQPPEYFGKLTFAMSYSKKAPDNLECIYIDDWIIRAIPYKIESEDISTTKNCIQLNKLQFYGFDKFDNKERIFCTDLIKFNLLSGSALIDSMGNLIHTGTSGETVSIEADFFNIKKQLNITFESELQISSFSTNNNEYSVNVTNNTDLVQRVSIIAAIFEKERLHSIKTISLDIDKHSMQTLSISLPLPYYLKNSDVRFFVWDSITGMKVVSEQ